MRSRAGKPCPDMQIVATCDEQCSTERGCKLGRATRPVPVKPEEHGAFLQCAGVVRHLGYLIDNSTTGLNDPSVEVIIRQARNAIDKAQTP